METCCQASATATFANSNTQARRALSISCHDVNKRIPITFSVTV